MGFHPRNDLSEVKNGELNLDFKVVIKTVGWWLTNRNLNKIKCKIELLELLGYWGWIPRVTEGSQDLFLALGRMTYSHLPNRIFI